MPVIVKAPLLTLALEAGTKNIASTADRGTACVFVPKGRSELWCRRDACAPSGDVPPGRRGGRPATAAPPRRRAPTLRPSPPWYDLHHERYDRPRRASRPYLRDPAASLQRPAGVRRDSARPAHRPPAAPRTGIAATQGNPWMAAVLADRRRAAPSLAGGSVGSSRAGRHPPLIRA